MHFRNSDLRLWSPSSWNLAVVLVDHMLVVLTANKEFHFFLSFFTWLKLLAIFMFSDGKGIMVDHNLWFIVRRNIDDFFSFFF